MVKTPYMPPGSPLRRTLYNLHIVPLEGVVTLVHIMVMLTCGPKSVEGNSRLLRVLVISLPRKGAQVPSSPKHPRDVYQERALLYGIILYCTILYFALLYTILYYTILYYTILYYTILYYTILCYAILYYTILYYTILYYTILYYTAR